MAVKTYDDLTPHAARVVSAFKLAYRQMGIPEHPDGKCPSAECGYEPLADGVQTGVMCGCEFLTDAVEERVRALLDDPLIEDAQACEDCHVLVPFLDDCYMIDAGNVVCLLCGEQRGFVPEQSVGHG